jgi:hypothetical protein
LHSGINFFKNPAFSSKNADSIVPGTIIGKDQAQILLPETNVRRKNTEEFSANQR